MKKNRIPQNTHDAVHLEDSASLHIKVSMARYTDPVTEALITFLEGKNADQQMLALKQLVTAWKSISGVQRENVQDILKVLVDTFWNCQVKNPLKKAVKGTLQKVPIQFHDCIVDSLSDCICMHLNTTKNNMHRHCVDNIASLLENFPLGEAAVTHSMLAVIKYIVHALAFFCSSVKSSRCAVDCVENMAGCLAALQVSSRLLTKSSDPLSDDKYQPLKHLYVIAWDILKHDCFSLDTKSAASVLIISIIKVCESADVSYVLANILQTSWDGAEKCLFDNSLPWYLNIGKERMPCSSSSLLSFCGGIVAILQEVDLLQPVPCMAPEGILFSSALPLFFHIISSTTDASTKLAASRTAVQLSSKMYQIVTNLSLSSAVKAKFSGKSKACEQLMQYAYMHWDDSVDVVRHQAKSVFTDVIRCHISVSGEATDGCNFLKSVLENIMNMSWHMRGKYAGLSALAEVLPVNKMLEKYPTLSESLLKSAKEQSIARHVCEIYVKFSIKHREEMNKAVSLHTWLKQWLYPMLATLCNGTTVQKQFVVEHLIPPFLKKISDILDHMLQYLASRTAGSGVMGAILVCVKQAKTLGLLTSPGEGIGDHWNGVVPVALLQKALCHQDDQVRLDALGLICENHKSTEAVPEIDLQLVRFFLTFNLNSGSPTFRQYLTAYLQKLISRMRDSAQVLEKHFLKKNDSHSLKKLEMYRNFLCWMVDFSFSCLHPSAAFPVRSCALGLLSTLMDIISLNSQSGSNPLVAFLCKSFTPDKVQTLLESLTDTFEQNKVEAFNVLQHVPLDLLCMEEKGKVRTYFETAVTLASSTKPQDCTTAAYLFKFLLQLPVLDQVLKDYLEEQKLHISMCSVSGRLLLVLNILLQVLKQQVETAKKNLLHAAATKPMYPALHCIRYLLQDLQMEKCKSEEQWKSLISGLIFAGLDVADVVSPVVSNSSPEGNVPLACLGPGLSVPVDTETEESSKTVNLMPEYLVVCCWRSIKEVSLLLGHLAESTPVADPTNEECGLVSVEQIQSVGSYFTRQLLESRHRGAFELAYAGFVKMSTMLWNSSNEMLHCLPMQWLDMIMNDIQSNSPDSKLCSTRRSAGVPFYIQALVTTEPTNKERKCLKIIMEQLIKLALMTDATLDSENAPKVHSLNILRALFRDTRLGDHVIPYVEDGIKAAIQGFSSQTWAIRNSSTLLFSALIQRIFGVKRGKDDYSKRNCMTGRVFFNRHKSLFQFLLTQLDEATTSLEEQGVVHLHPGLYPVLMILGRLYPSVLETSGAGFSLNAFVPFLMRCAKSPVLKTRLMTARALQPLVYKDHMKETLLQLFNQLPTTADASVSQNHVHGLLLQLHFLLSEVAHLPESARLDIGPCVVSALRKFQWIGTADNPCFLTRAEYMGTVLAANSVSADHSLVNQVLDLAGRGLQERVNTKGLPGFVDFQQICAKYILQSFSQQPTEYEQDEGIVLSCLNSDSYEVRQEVLMLLQNVFDEENVHSGLPKLAGSSIIFERLVEMAFAGEPNSDTFVLVLQNMIKHSCSYIFPWKSANNKEFNSKQVFEYLLKISMETNRDEIGSAAFQLSSLALQKLLHCDPGCSSVGDWLKCLKNKCSSRESDVWHTACATVLLENSPEILVDEQSLLGKDIFTVWECLMQLLQAEDEDVRGIAAGAVLKLHPWLPESIQMLCENQVHPFLALNVALAALLQVHGERQQLEMLHTLYSWLLEDLEPDWRGQNIEIRLFDKGEMNIYRDEGTFVNCVAFYLSWYLESALKHCEPDPVDSKKANGADLKNARSTCYGAPDKLDVHKSCFLHLLDNQGSFCDQSVYNVLTTDLKPHSLSEAAILFITKMSENTVNTINAYRQNLQNVTFSYPFLETQNFQMCQLKTFRYLTAIKVLSVCMEKHGVNLNYQLQRIKKQVTTWFTKVPNTQITMTLKHS